jgi:AcrR family transcriptional regulator
VLLLDAARDVFGREGFHAASMDAVARRAGVTKPTLYDHFPSKRDLYLALIDADLEAVRRTVSDALSAPTGNRERIRASFQAYFDFVDEHGPGFRLLMQEVVGADRDLRRRVGRVRASILAEVAELIVRESEGRLDPAHAETVALALVGMVETAAQQGHPSGDPGVRREAVDTLVRLAWRGITGLTEPDVPPMDATH